jgi:diacylglycerol kinase (ATP)
LFEPVSRLLQRGLDAVRFAAPDLTVIALGLVVFTVLIMKAFSREGTWLRGGWPSGHGALSFAAATIIGYVTGNASALALALFVAFLVVQSRVEAEIHTIAQSVLGALVGIIVTTAVFQLFFL